MYVNGSLLWIKSSSRYLALLIPSFGVFMIDCFCNNITHKYLQQFFKDLPIRFVNKIIIIVIYFCFVQNSVKSLTFCQWVGMFVAELHWYSVLRATRHVSVVCWMDFVLYVCFCYVLSATLNSEINNKNKKPKCSGVFSTMFWRGEGTKHFNRM